MVIDPSIIIIGLICLIATYGLLLGPERVRTLAISAYVGIVMASELSSFVIKALSERVHGSAQIYLKLGLLVLPIILLELGHHIKGHHRTHFKHGLIATLALSVLTALLLVSSGMKLLPPKQLHAALDSSFLTIWIYNWRLLWIGLVPLAVIAEAFIRPKESHH